MGMQLRPGRKPQVSTLRTVYLQVGLEPSVADQLLGVVELDQLDAVLDAWNTGQPDADLLLVQAHRRAAEGTADRLRDLL